MFDILFYYTDSDKIKSIVFKVKEGCTIHDFVLLNNLSVVIPKMNYNNYKIGVFGKIKKPDNIIKENDRLELYSPITIDPKIRRKNIATSR